MQCWSDSFLIPWLSSKQDLSESYCSCPLQHSLCLLYSSHLDWWGTEQFCSSCSLLLACVALLYLHLKRYPKWKLLSHLHCMHLRSGMTLFQLPKQNLQESFPYRNKFQAMSPTDKAVGMLGTFQSPNMTQKLTFASPVHVHSTAQKLTLASPVHVHSTVCQRSRHRQHKNIIQEFQAPALFSLSVCLPAMVRRVYSTIKHHQTSNLKAFTGSQSTLSCRASGSSALSDSIHMLTSQALKVGLCSRGGASMLRQCMWLKYTKVTWYVLEWNLKRRLATRVLRLSLNCPCKLNVFYWYQLGTKQILGSVLDLNRRKFLLSCYRLWMTLVCAFNLSSCCILIYAFVMKQNGRLGRCNSISSPKLWCKRKYICCVPPTNKQRRTCWNAQICKLECSELQILLECTMWEGLKKICFCYSNRSLCEHWRGKSNLVGFEALSCPSTCKAGSSSNLGDQLKPEISGGVS